MTTGPDAAPAFVQDLNLSNGNDFE